VPKFASWDENLASHTPEVQAAARALEALIRAEQPDVVVQYDPGNGLLAFGRSMKMSDLLFALIPHASWVNLQLADGALLPNPDGLIERIGRAATSGDRSGTARGALGSRADRRGVPRASSGELPRPFSTPP
jgi:hypothetical protein